jgi:hypothetical protein
METYSDSSGLPRSTGIVRRTRCLLLRTAPWGYHIQPIIRCDIRPRDVIHGMSALGPKQTSKLVHSMSVPESGHCAVMDLPGCGLRHLTLGEIGPDQCA